MARTDQVVNVAVTDKGKAGGKRTVLIEVEAGAEACLLSDLLAEQGALDSIEKHFRAVNRKAVLDYISSGKDFVKEATKDIGGKTKREVEKVAQDKSTGSQLL